MKKLFFLALVIVIAGLACVFKLQAAEKKKLDPSKIYGRIQFVKSFPDYKVKAVTSFPDLKVKVVKSLPGPGEWEIVNSFPDYKIQMVNSFPDFTVEFADGVPDQAK
ncbi:MAG TPA: hypothetical protein VK968_20135 [Roseimicrobium sp.]|nr:hypothetical protein [Roseimicrobium sp.]